MGHATFFTVFALATLALFWGLFMPEVRRVGILRLVFNTLLLFISLLTCYHIVIGRPNLLAFSLLLFLAQLGGCGISIAHIAVA